MSKVEKAGFSLLDAIRPAHGWETDFAILTTYSSDLVVKGAVMLALAGLDDERGTGSRVDFATAHERLRGRLKFLVQSGRMSLPKAKPPAVLAIVDQYITEIRMDENEGSWHPKLALVRYSVPGEQTKAWRLWVGSRNLTRDMSWDIGLLLAGSEGGGGKPVEGIADAGRVLAGLAEIKSGKPAAIYRELSNMSWSAPEGSTVEAVRLRHGETGADLPEDPGDLEELLVVSPFIDGSTVRRLGAWGDASTRRSLLSTKSELEKLRAQASAPTRGFEDLLFMGSPSSEDWLASGVKEDEGEEVLRGLHAKIIAARSRSGRVRFWLGSANATTRGWRGANTEAIAEMAVSEDLFGWLKAFVERQHVLPAEGSEDETDGDEDENLLEDFRKSIASKCDLSIEFGEEAPVMRIGGAPPIPAGVKLEAGIYCCPLREWHRGAAELTLPHVAPHQVTELVTVRLSVRKATCSWIHRARLVFPLADERDNQILAFYLSPRIFLEWIRSLLNPEVIADGGGDWDEEPNITDGCLPAGGSEKAGIWWAPSLEEILRAWSRNPAAVVEIDRKVSSYARFIRAQEPSEDPESRGIFEEFDRTWKLVRKQLIPKGSREPMTEPKPFQEATARAALASLRRRGGARFLVADEVGLGKTVVAQKILSELIKDNPRGPLTVFYVCSNLSIASQNRDKLLEVLPRDERSRAHCGVDRLTLVPTSKPLDHPKLRLYTLTPETSIPFRNNRRRDGRQEERALLHCLTSRLWPELLKRRGRKMFQRNARRWWKEVVNFQSNQLDAHPGLASAFKSSVRKELDLEPGQHLLPRLLEMEEDLQIIAAFRSALAACAIERLRPDLVIFDEFQNFRDILEPDLRKESGRVIAGLRGEGMGTPPWLLLLSATPYRLYTRNSELAEGISHHAEFFGLIRFLLGPDGRARKLSKRCEQLFNELELAIRRGALHTSEAKSRREEIQRLLKPIIARTERASHHDGWNDHATIPLPSPLHGDDLKIFAHLSRSFADHHRSSAVSFWTSIPLPAQTMGSRYKVWEHARRGSPRPTIPCIDRETRDAFGGLNPFPHPRFRALRKLAGTDLLSLPWLPPSLPWWRLRKEWSGIGDSSGKILIFSRFRAAPQAIASFLSYELERDMFETRPFRYGDISERKYLQPGPNRHALLAYFHPSPWLVSATDPLAAKDTNLPSIKRALQRQIREALKKLDIAVNRKSRRKRPMWKLLARIERRAGDLARENGHQAPDDISSQWWDLHKAYSKGESESQGTGKLLIDWCAESSNDPGEISPAELQALAEHALSAPGIVLGRALSRHWDGAVDEEGFYFTLEASWQGLRNYLDHPVFAARLAPEGEQFPSAICRAVVDGNLEAVLDEHFWLQKTLYNRSGDQLATSLTETLELRSGLFHLHELKGQWRKGFPLRTHAAMPFTEIRVATVKGSEKTGKPLRTDELRKSFNSPFWPHVLATTSVGQEGLDFHAWCSRLVHWDLCSNPVDLEQREGRIQRFAGRSIRLGIVKNVGDDSLDKRSPGESPWDAIEVAANEKLADESGLSPWWVLRGSDVERFVFDVPTSDQRYRLQWIKEQRMLYRLVLGQPSQEDLVEILRSGKSIDEEDVRDATVELSPWFASRSRRAKSGSTTQA